MLLAHPVKSSRAAVLPAADLWLARAARAVRLLGAATPTNAVSERARLDRVYRAGKESLPRWEYAPCDHSALRQALLRLAHELDARDGSPVAVMYADRALELECEAHLASAVGTPALDALARRRFGTLPARLQADALAREWLRLEVSPCDPEEPALKTDADDPRSLFRRMHHEVRARQLPFMVKKSPVLTSLAAMSHDTIWVVEGRLATPTDVERTIVHELLAHAMPRVRASTMPLGIFAFGTARGSDDQEGLALLFEERRGFSTATRRRELAARHIAVERMRRGASFVETVRSLRADGIATTEAVRISERAFRGSTGQKPGLGREGVYLDAFVRVRAHLAAHPQDEAVLGCGLVALNCICPLRPFALPKKGVPVHGGDRTAPASGRGQA